MKCIVCHGETIQPKKVEEDILVGNDIVRVIVEANVCQTCGERYYSRHAMKYLEDVEKQLGKKKKALREVGKILAFE